jgi:cytochrome oxidase Cu insertion factor (SCO1/SenC/PrrC family)
MTPKPSPGQQSAPSGPPAVPDGPLPPPAPGPRPGRWPAQRLLALGLIAVFLLAAVVTATYFTLRPRSTSLPRPSGIPADVPSSLVNLMFLSPLPHLPAPGFTLTDQTGRTMSLSALRGKVVVLEFMDPHCVDICPIVSQEFVDAYHDLGPLASKVAFIAVNVNQYHATVADVATFSREHALTTIPGWHFFTGPVPALQESWRAYHIAVQAPSPNADIVHTSAIYFIDPQGREAFLASPMTDHTSKGAAFLPAAQLTEWGRGIALIARHLAG